MSMYDIGFIVLLSILVGLSMLSLVKAVYNKGLADAYKDCTERLNNAIAAGEVCLYDIYDDSGCGGSE